MVFFRKPIPSPTDFENQSALIYKHQKLAYEQYDLILYLILGSYAFGENGGAGGTEWENEQF